MLKRLSRYLPYVALFQARSNGVPGIRHVTMPSYPIQTAPAHVSRQQAERICMAAEKAGHLAHVIFTGPPTPDASGDYDGARAPYRRVSSPVSFDAVAFGLVGLQEGCMDGTAR